MKTDGRVVEEENEEEIVKRWVVSKWRTMRQSP